MVHPDPQRESDSLMLTVAMIGGAALAVFGAWAWFKRTLDGALRNIGVTL